MFPHRYRKGVITYTTVNLGDRITSLYMRAYPNTCPPPMPQVRLWGEHGYFSLLTRKVIENEKQLESELEAAKPDSKSSKKIKKTKSQKNNKAEGDTVKVGVGSESERVRMRV